MKKFIIENVQRLCTKMPSAMRSGSYNSPWDFDEEELKESIEEAIKYDEKIPNLLYRFKWLKEMIRNIKQAVPFLKYMPMLERVLIFIERKLNGRVTYIDS